MKFMALGGAQEIGAACYLLEIDGKKLLIDCGVRHVDESTNSARPAPQFESVEQADAILVTNAQLGRIGALQIALSRYRDAFCFMTVPTFPLAVTQYLAILRGIEGDAPTHFQPIDWITREEIERLSDRVVSVKFDKKFHPFKRFPLTVTFIRAGYILGAAGILIQGEEGSAFFTGDFTLSDRRTVPGADFLNRFKDKKLDLLVSEMTNAAREEYSVEQGENRLFDLITGTISKGGHVLIPSQALGLSQELILIVKGGQAAGRVPPAPIFVDGLVRQICDQYDQLIQRGLFFREEDSRAPIIRVSSHETRKFAFAGGPCIVIASSGQLFGGPAVSYAMELLPKEKNTIILVNTVMRRSPARKLLDTKTGEEMIFEDTGEPPVQVNAQVVQTAVSLSADSTELTKLAYTLNPRTVIGVYGSPNAAQAFRGHLKHAGYKGRVWTPSQARPFDPLV